MRCSSEKITDGSPGINPRPVVSEAEPQKADPAARSAFSLIETMTALVILGFVSSSVLVVINRCMVSVADSSLRMQAFEVAHENMEKLLSSNSVTEKVEIGNSDMYPEIEWNTTVEAIELPEASTMWAQAVCSAAYIDAEGERQTVELTAWLTNLTTEQTAKIAEEKQKEKEKLADQIVETEQSAAEYAGVNVETVRQWVDNGMLQTGEGYYIKGQLDLYKKYDGNPPQEAIAQQKKIDADLIGSADKQDKQLKNTTGQKSSEGKVEKQDSESGRLPGNSDIENMTPAEMMKYIDQFTKR